MDASPFEDLSGDQLLELYRRMVRIRQFETRVSKLYQAGEIPGFVHLSIGQEGTAVGGCWPLSAGDHITSTHRGHGHCLAKGMSMTAMFAELFGRPDGACRGLGGSMHIADPAEGVLGANGIVGAGLPIAVGAALTNRLRDRDGVVVAFFGDGAAATGAFHEAVNLAAVWELPVVFLCEDNGIAEFSASRTQHRVPVSARAAAYGLPGVDLDGNDVVTMAKSMTRIIADIRAGSGPVLLSAHTSRWSGHYEGDPQRYRTEDDHADLRSDDPIARLRDSLSSDPIVAAKLDQIDQEILSEVGTAENEARGSTAEPLSLSSALVYSARSSPAVGSSADGELSESGDEWRMMDALRLALQHEMEDDPEVFLAGIDIGAGGNVFGITRGLHQMWPDRVLDTPISETAIVGCAVGAAALGMRPVVEIMYMDFLGVCLDQLLNQAAKLRFMSGGRVSVPMTLRTQFGAGRSSGSQHSQSLEALLAHIPGLTVVLPSTPADAYGLLRASIQDPSPVIFIEHRLMYGSKGPTVPRGHTLPLGKAAIRRLGHDITVVSLSRMVHEALAAAEEVASEGIDAEVIDLRTVVPLDFETVLESLGRTGRLLVAHEAVRDFGIGAEIVARAADAGFWKLDAPPWRIGAAYSPAPYAPDLERAWLPDRHDIAESLRRLAAI